MKTPPLLVAALAAAFSAGALGAQLPGKGDKAPAFDIDEAWRGAPESFQKLANKVVLLDFFQTWCKPCAKNVPELNELHEKFASQGLVILGVSDERTKLLETYVKGKRPKYGIVRTAKGLEDYDIDTYPTFVLIGADGRVTDEPSHKIPAEHLIRAALLLAVRIDDLPEIDAVAPLRDAWTAERWKDVADWFADELPKARLDEKTKEFAGRLETRFKADTTTQLARIDRLAQGPDYLAATEHLTELSRRWRGLEVGRKASATSSKLRRDPKVRVEISAMKKLRAILKRYDPQKPSQRRSMTKALKALRSKYEGTWAAGKAETKIARLARM